MKRKRFKKAFVLMLAAHLFYFVDARAQEVADSPCAPDSVAVYIERLRRGDFAAYWESVARYYVSADSNEERGLLNGCMLAILAEMRGHKGVAMSWFENLPSESLGAKIYNLLMNLDRGDLDLVWQQAKEIEKHGVPVECVHAAICLHQQDKKGTTKFASEAAEKGSLLGKILYAVATDDTSVLLSFVDQVPFFYNLLAREVGGDKDVLSSEENERKAALYYKADELGVLTPRGADWLLHYFDFLKRKTGHGADAAEVERLRILAVQ